MKLNNILNENIEDDHSEVVEAFAAAIKRLRNPLKRKNSDLNLKRQCANFR